MTPIWELQLEHGGAGWKGWRITLVSDVLSATFSFDERDGIDAPHEAVRKALLSEPAQRMAAKGGFEVKVTEIRTVISTEINPN